MPADLADLLARLDQAIADGSLGRAEFTAAECAVLRERLRGREQCPAWRDARGDRLRCERAEGHYGEHNFTEAC